MQTQTPFQLPHSASLASWAAPFLMLVGALLRLETWLDNRSLWIDEAALAMALRGTDLAGVLAPLPGYQAGPTGFLLVSRLLMDALGDSEYVLRLLPLLASLLVLPLFWRLARRVLDSAPALLALLLFAVSPHLIYYAAEFKPYAFDVLAAVGILLAAFRLHDSGYAARAAWLAAVVGAAAVFFSYSAIFMLAGSGLALLLTQLPDRPIDRRALSITVVVGAVWLGSFLLDWWLVTAARRDPHYYDTLVHAWPPLPVSLAAIDWYWDALIATVERPLGFYRVPVLAALGMVAGMTVLWPREKLAFRLLIFPLVLVALAAVLRQYPPVNRLLLFTVPMFVLLLSAGVAGIARSFGGTSRVLAAVFVLLIVVGPVGSAGKRLLTQEKRHELREPMAHLLAHYQPGDQIQVFDEAEKPFLYYAREHDLPWSLAGDTTLWFEDETAGQELSGRVWFVTLDARPVTYIFRFEPVGYGEPGPGVSMAEAVLDARGRRLAASEAYRAAVYLYEM